MATISLRQELIPDRLLGRVFSAFRLFGFASMALGTVVSGLLAREFGIPVSYWVAAATMAILSVACALLVNNRAVEEAREQARTRTTE